MKTLIQSPLWMGAVLLLLTHQFFQKILLFKIPFLDNWLDPFLSMPVLLGLILVERRWFLNRKSESDLPYSQGDLKSPCEYHSYNLSKLETVITVLFFALIFEFIFPKYSDGFTFDWWDFLAYGLGGFLFYIKQPFQDDT